MQKIEAQQILTEILRQAEEGKSTEFRLIKSWSEFIFFWQTFKATKVVIKTLQEAADKIFKSYCKRITIGNAVFTQLLAYAHVQEVRLFYERDLATLKKMLDEYDDYLGQGHFWYSLLGGERW